MMFNSSFVFGSFTANRLLQQLFVVFNVCQCFQIPKVLSNCKPTAHPLERKTQLTAMVLAWAEGIAWVAIGFGAVLDSRFWNRSSGAPRSSFLV